MWVFTKSGFFSVVEDVDDKSWVLVRARARKDLVALRLGVKIVETPNADYGFRCRVPKIKWADKMLELSLEIDYPNFKKTVPSRNRLYSEVWMTMRSLQAQPRRINERQDQADQLRKGVRFHPNRIR